MLIHLMHPSLITLCTPENPRARTRVFASLFGTLRARQAVHNASSQRWIPQVWSTRFADNYHYPQGRPRLAGEEHFRMKVPTQSDASKPGWLAASETEIVGRVLRRTATRGSTTSGNLAGLSRKRPFVRQNVDNVDYQRERLVSRPPRRNITRPDTPTEAAGSPRTSEPAPTGVLAWWRRLWGG